MVNKDDVVYVKPRKRKHSQEFSKWLLVQETLLIWIVTIGFFALAFLCIKNQYFGELPWLTGMAAFPWTAYGISQAFYYRKATAENTKNGLKYEVAMYEQSHTNDENGALG